jgi:hypothetical protein
MLCIRSVRKSIHVVPQNPCHPSCLALIDLSSKVFGTKANKSSCRFRILHLLSFMRTIMAWLTAVQDKAGHVYKLRSIAALGTNHRYRRPGCQETAFAAFPVRDFALRVGFFS